MTNYYLKDAMHGNSRIMQENNSTPFADCNAEATSFDTSNKFCIEIQVWAYQVAGACNKDISSSGVRLEVRKGVGGSWETLAASDISGYACSGISDEGSQGSSHCGDPSAAECGSGYEAGVQTTDGVTSKTITKEYYTSFVVGCDPSGCDASTSYYFRLYDTTSGAAIPFASGDACGAFITTAAVAATQLVHTDGGEDYCLLSDNDGAAIDLGNITLATTEECYNYLDDNDGNAIDLTQTFVLVHTDAGEDYLTHAADPLDLIVILDVNEAYHLIDDNDGNPIAITEKAYLTIVGDYCLISDNDGSAITLGAITISIEDCYNAHYIDPCDPYSNTLIVNDCYHLHYVDEASFPTLITHAVAEVLRDGDPNAWITHAVSEVIRDGLPDAAITQAIAEVLRDFFHPYEAFHDHIVDTITELSITSWDGGDVGSEGTLVTGKNYRMIVLSTDFTYGQSDGYVRAQLKGAPTESVTINGASIGQRKAAADAFDYDTSSVLHVRFTFNGGDASVTIPAGQTVWSDWVPFAVDDTKDHLLHIFCSAAHKYSYRVTSDCYKGGTGADETMTADVKNYTLENEFLFFTQLEVRARTVMEGFADTYHLHDVDSTTLDVTINIQEVYHEHYADPVTYTINLVHPDAGEDYLLHVADSCDIKVQLPVQDAYHLISDNDGNPIRISTYLANLDAYHLLDDNDGNPLDFAQHFLTTAECYHLLSDNDGNPIIVTETGIVTLANLDSYHTHVVDLADPLAITLYLTEECYHVLDDNDGSAITLGTITISIEECYHTHDVENIDLDQHFLTTADCYHEHVIDNVDPFAITLTTTEECYHELVSDNIDLSGKATLANLDSYHTHAVDNVDFEQHFLSVADNYHSHAVDPCDLANITLSTTEECYHLLDDNDGNAVDLTQRHILIHTDAGEDYCLLIDDGPIALVTEGLLPIDSAYHAHVVDSANIFSVNGLYHDIISDNVGLVVLLDINESNHDIVSDEPSFDITITIAETYHTHVVDPDPIPLTGKHILSVDELYHIIATDPIALTGKHILDVDETYHLIVSDNISLAGVSNLVIPDVYHDHVVDAIMLIVEPTISDVYHDHAVGPIVLSQENYLTITDNYLRHYVDSIVVTTPSLIGVVTKTKVINLGIKRTLHDLTPERTLMRLSA